MVTYTKGQKDEENISERPDSYIITHWWSELTHCASNPNEYRTEQPKLHTSTHIQPRCSRSLIHEQEMFEENRIYFKVSNPGDNISGVIHPEMSSLFALLFHNLRTKSWKHDRASKAPEQEQERPSSSSMKPPPRHVSIFSPIPLINVTVRGEDKNNIQ